MAPALAQFEQQYGSKIKIIAIDVDQAANYQQYAKYKTSNYIPETVVLKNGMMVEKKVGAMTLDQLVAAMNAGLK